MLDKDWAGARRSARESGEPGPVPGAFNFSKTILPAPAKQGAPKTPAAMATRR